MFALNTKKIFFYTDTYIVVYPPPLPPPFPYKATYGKIIVVILF